MKRLFLSVIIALTLLITFSTTASAALMLIWAPSVNIVRSSGAGSPVEGTLVPIRILPEKILLDGYGKLTIYVEIPEDYNGVGAEDLAETSFTMLYDESDVVGAKSSNTSLTVIFTVNNGEEEAKFYSFDDVVILQK